MNEKNLIERMLRLLKLSERNEHGVPPHGHWSQYRYDYFCLFQEMCAAGLDVPEDIIADHLSDLGPGAIERWKNNASTAWSEWRFAWAQFQKGTAVHAY